jgi:drug/metabolite transporter (DMT)-like permease
LQLTNEGSLMASSPVTRSFPIYAFLILLAGGIATGFAGILMRLTDVNPLASAFWRMALAAPVLWIWALSMQKQDKALGQSTTFSPRIGLASLCFAGDMGIWHLALHYTTVSNATLLNNFTPLFIAIWLWLVHKTRFSTLFLIGMGGALLGAVLLIGPNAVQGSNRLLGDGLGLLSGVFYAGYQLLVKDARDSYSTIRLMAWISTMTALIILPFALWMNGAFWPANATGWVVLLALAVVAQICGQTVIAYASAHLSVALSSLSLLVQPLVATVAALLVFAEQLNNIQVLGGFLLLAGIYLAKRAS